MNDRNLAAARLLAEKLDLALPTELIAAALSQLASPSATAGASGAAQPLPPDAAVDTRPLAGLFPTPAVPAAASDQTPDMAELLPRLLGQLGSSDSPNRRVELAAAASMLGALLGGASKDRN